MLKEILFPIITSFAVTLFGILILLKIKTKPYENNRAEEIAKLISEGLNAYIKRVFSSILQVAVYIILAFGLFTMIFNKRLFGNQMLAFFFASLLMGILFIFCLKIAERILPRIIKSTKNHIEGTLQLTLNSSAGLGFIIIGTMIFGLSICYVFLGIDSLIGYGLGVILTAYIFRISGGVFKTASDIGSEIISTLDKNIPYFDPRNPLSLLDIIGDWISKVFGFCSDILSSFMLTVIASIIFSHALLRTGYINVELASKMQQIPIYIVTVGLIVSVIIFFFGKIRIKYGYHNFLLESIYLAIFLSLIGANIIINTLQINTIILPIWSGSAHFSLFIPYLIGLVGAVLISFTTEYLTSTRFQPSRNIAKEAEFGPIIPIFTSTANSFKSLSLFLAYIILILIPSIYFTGFYGILIASLGMISVTGTIIIINIFTPLLSNTAKIIKLVNEDNIAIRNTVKMENLANTTVALGNGFLIGTSIITSFAIFFAMVLMMLQVIEINDLFLIDLKLIIGLMIGSALPLIFVGFILRSLTKTILMVIKEGFRQFRDIPYLNQDKARPDIIKASDDTTIKAMNSLILPTIIMILVPLIIGYSFGILGFKILVGLVLGGILISIIMGFYWSTIGETLNNAKKYIGKGHFGGTGSPNFENIKITDSFGDVYKDLLAPSLSMFIKVIVILNILIITLLL